MKIQLLALVFTHEAKKYDHIDSPLMVKTCKLGTIVKDLGPNLEM
jgi:hypothetical protein